jgi:RNA polymerase sigma-70 factor (ECF subfamily)
MKCDELKRRFAEYSEGALPDDLCAEVERHLAGCPPCADLDRDLQDLQRLCRESPRPCLPEDARKRIERLLQGRGDEG